MPRDGSQTPEGRARAVRARSRAPWGRSRAGWEPFPNAAGWFPNAGRTRLRRPGTIPRRLGTVPDAVGASPEAGRKRPERGGTTPQSRGTNPESPRKTPRGRGASLRLSGKIPRAGSGPADSAVVSGRHGWASFWARASISFSFASMSGRNCSRSGGNQRIEGSRQSRLLGWLTRSPARKAQFCGRQ